MSSSKNQCDFEFDTNKKCQNKIIAGYKYCQEHLELLTRIHTKTALYNCISEQLCLDITLIEDSSHIMDNLGADSLEVVGLIMALEEAFDLEISDEEAEKLSKVIDAYNFIYISLLKKKKYLQSPISDIIKAYEAIKNRLSSVKREVKTILKSDLFIDYMSRLNLQSESVFSLICNVVRNNWIEHVTTVPNISKDNKLLGAHIIFLTKRYIFYFYIKHNNIEFRSLKINEFSLHSHYKYDKEGSLLVVLIKFYYQRHGDKKNLSFEFTSKTGISAAEIFMNKYLTFLENT